jgi:hypothetical protein
MNEQLGQHPTQPNSNTGTTEVSSGDEGRPYKNYAKLISWANRPSQEASAESIDIPERPVEHPPFDNTTLFDAVNTGRINTTLPEDFAPGHFATAPAPARETEFVLPGEQERNKKFWTPKKIGAAVMATVAISGGAIFGLQSGEKEAGNHGYAVSTEFVDHGISIPNKSFSKDRPANELPDSVVEQGLFQTLSPATQHKIRSIESMDLDTFRSLDQATKNAYAQFIFAANAPNTFAFYEANSDHELTDEIKDAYIHGVTADTAASVVEAVHTLRVLAISTMEERANGQPLSEATHYTQGDDKSKVHNQLVTDELINASTTGDATWDRRMLTEVTSVPEPKPLLNDYYISASSPLFSGKNYMLFQTGSPSSGKDVLLRVTHAHLNGPNGAVEQHTDEYSEITNTFLTDQPSGRYSALRARTVSAEDTTFTQNLNMFGGRTSSTDNK